MQRGRRLAIVWQDEAAALYARYRQEIKPDLRPRWHALWLLRTGTTVRKAARVLGGMSARCSNGWPGTAPAG